MSLTSWLSNAWIETHATTSAEITDLLSVVERDLTDAAVRGISADARGNFSYNAALQLATLAMYAEGYRPGRQRSHERSIQSLRYTIGADAKIIDLLDVARRKRNTANYDRAGGTSAKEADEMYNAARELRESVLTWLRKRHKELME